MVDSTKSFEISDDGLLMADSTGLNVFWIGGGSATPTFDAPINSYYYKTNEDIYYQEGPGATNWVNKGPISTVIDVVNSDGSLTISPTTGNVIASINASNDVDWQVKQTFSAGLNIADNIQACFGDSDDGTIEWDTATGDLFIKANAVNAVGEVKVESSVSITEQSSSISGNILKTESGDLDLTSGGTKISVSHVARSNTLGSSSLFGCQTNVQIGETGATTTKDYACYIGFYNTMSGEAGTLNGRTAAFVGIFNPGFSQTIASWSGFFMSAIVNSGVTVSELTSLRASDPLTNFGTITLQSGMTCEKQTKGTTNVGIIMEGDGVGADITFGAGRDATQYYDGTDLIIDPDRVGSGRVLIGLTGDDDLLLNDIEIDGDLNHDGSGVGFYGTAPVAQSSAYTPTNVSADRAYDANSTTVDELADVLGTLIADLQATGLVA